MGLLIDPIEIDLLIHQGATFRREFQWSSGDSAATALPVDLTGCTARAQVRESHPSPLVLVAMTTENGGITLGGAAGTLTLTLPDETTALLPILARPARWDLEVAWPDGDVTRVFEGRVRITPEVTRG